MATLHMNVEQCRSVKTGIDQTRNELSNQATQLKQRVDGMIGSDWIAPGAEQFKTEVDSWNQSLVNLLSQLEELAVKLDREITEWEATGQNM